MDKRQGAGAGKILLSLLYMVWFVASLAGMIYLAKTGRETLMLAVLGQYFLVFGIAGILSNIKNKALLAANLIFPLAGLGMIAVSLWLTYGGERGKEILMARNFGDGSAVCQCRKAEEEVYACGQCGMRGGGYTLS